MPVPRDPNSTRKKKNNNVAKWPAIIKPGGYRYTGIRNEMLQRLLDSVQEINYCQNSLYRLDP